MISKHLVKLKDIPLELAQYIISENNSISYDSEIDFDMVISYRLKLIENELKENGSITSDVDAKILSSIKNKDFISNNSNTTTLTRGEKAADNLAKFGGSWTFIIIFIMVLVIWIFLNATMILFKAFDPYPFILLNLTLSCLAAIQAPIILMSQNRQAQYDRVQAQNDYEINLKSEIEIRLLHEKIDHILEVDLFEIKKELEKRK